MISKIFFLLFLIPYLGLIPWKKYFSKFEFSRGNQLLWSVYKIEEEVFYGRVPSIPKNYKYKFYSSLLESFLLYSRQYGMPLFNFLGEFKHQLGKDLQMERKLFKELRDGVVQFIFIGVISFGFWTCSHIFLELKISYSFNFFLAFFLQLTGMIIFLSCFYVFKRKLVETFYRVFQSYYLFWGLSSVGLPVVEVLGACQILELKPLNGGLMVLNRRMESLVSSWKDKGFPVKNSVEDVISELWDLYNVKFQVFRRNLKIVNFLTMALFYLSAFFILLMDFMGVFLIELK
jgi:hypothetical protein